MIIFNKDIKLRLGGLENSYDKLRDELEEQIKDLGVRISKLSDEKFEDKKQLIDRIAKLERIIKYAKDGELTYVLEKLCDFSSPVDDRGYFNKNFITEFYMLRIYYNKQEYEFVIKEFCPYNTYIEASKISRDKDTGLIYLCLRASDSDLMHYLTLDIKNGNYIHASYKS